VYLTRGVETTALLSATSNNMGNMEEAVAFLHFFANNYDQVIVRPGAASSSVLAGAGSGGVAAHPGLSAGGR